MVKFSVVSPVYKAETTVEELVRQVKAAVSKITEDYEIILVDDGSPDQSWLRIEQICATEPSVKGIKLSRNFGQHYAVTAGLCEASGDLILILDCDLQDDPANLSLLMNEHIKGNEIVFTTRIKRRHTLRKRIYAGIYNALFGFFSERSYDVNAGSMVLFTKKVKDNIIRLQDRDRLYLQMLKWVGFTSTYVPVEHRPRHSGKSSYNMVKLLTMALQGWTSHSDKLLKFSIYGGFILSFLTFLISIVIVIRYFTEGLQPGWPSLFIAIMFSTGLILMSIGITGIYIGKIFEQSKNRPLYIVEKRVN
ncbi:MAG TPA: glycosyltransferase family 2 protein [Chryseosolibacter sp.]